ncbi:MAG: helix-turn-helix domain-containing protein [Ruminiclostridium sp.]|nr:helix-turn-helix domain-containing protein [Ruminiclostridium sp.]
MKIVGKRSKIAEIIIKKGDKLTIRNINGRSISGEVTNINEEAAEAMLFEAYADSNFKVHHIEITAQASLSSPNNISEVLTFSEAAEIWNIDPSTLRHRVTGEELNEGIDYRKSGKVWLISRKAIERLYGLK